MPRKSVEKSVGPTPPNPFRDGPDPRRGKGPEKGAPNAGRPRSALRERMREALESRLQVAEEIADGVVPIRLSQKCEHCGKEPAGPAPSADEVVKVAASGGDRLRALDFFAKYGVGPLKGVTEDAVESALAESLQVIDEEAPPEAAERIRKRLKAIWR